MQVHFFQDSKTKDFVYYSGKNLPEEIKVRYGRLNHIFTILVHDFTMLSTRLNVLKLRDYRTKLFKE